MRCRDVRRLGLPRRDGDTLGGCKKLVLIQLHSVCTCRHRGRGEGASRVSVHPELVVEIVPVHYSGEARRYARCSSGDISAVAGDFDVASQVETVKERDIDARRIGASTARHAEDVRSVKTCAIGFGLDVARVHVIGEGIVVANGIGTDVTEEWTAGALLGGLMIWS